MPIKSYLAHSHKGKKAELVNALSTIGQCEVMPAENKDVVIVVTDTEDQIEEEILKKKLDTLESLKFLAMVSGFNAPQND